MCKTAGTGGSFKDKLGTVGRESSSATVGRVARGARETKERGVDGRCGWQPAKPLQLCSHVNNKQEKRRALASLRLQPEARGTGSVSSDILGTQVPRYLDTSWPISPV